MSEAELIRYRRTRDRHERRLKARGKPAEFLSSTTEAEKIRLRLTEISVKRGAGGGNVRPESIKKLPTSVGVHALSFATRYLEGGRERFIEFVQLAVLNNHPAATAFYEVFLDLSTYQRDLVSFDDVCAAAGVRPSDLMACVVSSAMEMSRDTGNLVAALMHPEIVRQSAKSGKRIGGDFAQIALEDRRMLFQHSGFIPTPKNSTINIHASANAQAAAAAAAEPSVPKFAADLDAVDRRDPASLMAPTPKFLTESDSALDASTAAVPAVLIADDETD